MSNCRKLRIAIKLLVFTCSILFSATSNALNLDGLVNHKGFMPSHTSIVVIDADSGKLIGAVNPDMQLNPASCMKVITASAALARLGSDYRFSTNFYADKGRSGNVGTLFVAGSGDPLFINEEIERMANDLRRRGLKSVSGGIVVDDSFFDSEDFPKKTGTENRSYSAKVSALSANFNSAEVVIEGGKKPVAFVNPPIDYIRIVNKLRFGKKMAVAIDANSEGGFEVFTVRGTIPSKLSAQSLYKPVKNPSLYAGALIKHYLQKSGVAVSGEVRKGIVPQGAVLISSEKSRPLYEIVQKMNKVSNNFIAEQITKHMGAVSYGAPGSTHKGVRAYSDFMRQMGIPDGTYLLENGSGLSENTSISARQLAFILASAYRDETIRDHLVDSLPVLGVDGTTKRWKFEKSLIGVARAKTGTLNGVSTLAGFVPMQNGHTAAFAILANGIRNGAWNAHVAQLQVVRAIAEEGR